MGRYSTLLSPQLADLAGVVAGQRVLDVGCGTGALTAELVARVGPYAVSAVDPSESFVEAARARHSERRRPQGVGRAAPVRRCVVRRHARAARRPLHGGPGRRRRRDATGHATRRRRRRVRLGSRRRSGPARALCGTPHVQLDPGVAGEPLRAGSREGDLRASVRGRRAARGRGGDALGDRRASRPSTSGGSRSPSASGRPAPTSQGSTRSGRLGCGSGAARSLPEAPFALTAHAWTAYGRA